MYLYTDLPSTDRTRIQRSYRTSTGRTAAAAPPPSGRLLADPGLAYTILAFRIDDAGKAGRYKDLAIDDGGCWPTVKWKYAVITVTVLHTETQGAQSRLTLNVGAAPVEPAELVLALIAILAFRTNFTRRAPSRRQWLGTQVLNTATLGTLTRQALFIAGTCSPLPSWFWHSLPFWLSEQNSPSGTLPSSVARYTSPQYSDLGNTDPPGTVHCWYIVLLCRAGVPQGQKSGPFLHSFKLGNFVP